MKRVLRSPIQRAALVLLGLGGVLAGAADAACNTAPTAADDAARTYARSIAIDVLANDVDDGQALSVSVASETCPGTVSVDFDLVTCTPSTPLGQDCLIYSTVRDDEGLSDSALVTVSADIEIFIDDFESGDASAWSACSPSSP